MIRIYDYLKEAYERHRAKILSAGALSLALLALFLFNRKSLPLVKLNEFMRELNQERVQEVVVRGTAVLFRTIGSAAWLKTQCLLSDESLMRLLEEHKGLTYSFQPAGRGSAYYMNLLALGSVTALTLNLLFKQLVSKSFSKMPSDKNVLFKDIAGNDEAKTALQEVVRFIKNSKQYSRIGLRNRRGVLLFGPPGTGKTMLAKAMANQCGASFLYASAASFIEIFVGVGSKKVRELFAEARRKAPTIVFLDEIDALGKRSDLGMNEGQRNNTINQLLTELDGFESVEDVVVVAATNRIELLEPALLRSRRFDLKIRVGLPDKGHRREMLQRHAQRLQIPLGEDQLQLLSEGTAGLSGADLQNLTNECKIRLLREDPPQDKIRLFEQTLKAMFPR